MTKIAYIANEFPSPAEPYVMDEILELRRRGVEVICCSGKRGTASDLSVEERAFHGETKFFQPLTDSQLMRAGRSLISERRALRQILGAVLLEPRTSLGRRIRTLGHTLMGSSLADELEPLGVEHIHAHHGYFAAWMAMVAARLLGIGFSFTLHGSDLLSRADLLSTKLKECQFCVTISDFNRRHILKNYPGVRPEQVLVQRLGVDRVFAKPRTSDNDGRHNRFCLLSVGRLHAVKNHRFLIEACAELRKRGVDFICWIVGEGEERASLERQISELKLQGFVYLIGRVPRADLSGYYRYADLVVMTSKSEGIPVALMEAMAHQRLVLAPAITGIPELVEHQRTGFLYQAECLDDFVNAVCWIQSHLPDLAGIEKAAAASIGASYNRQRNLRAFAEEFLTRIAQPEGDHAHSLLQQVRLSV